MDNFSFEESGELVSGGKYRCSGEAFINAFAKDLIGKIMSQP